MGKNKDHGHNGSRALDPEKLIAKQAKTRAKLEKKAGKARAKFDQKAAKLERRRMKAELRLWEVDVERLMLQATVAEEERRPGLKQEIADLTNRLEEAHQELRDLKVQGNTSPQAAQQLRESWADTERAIQSALARSGVSSEPVPESEAGAL